MNQISLYPLRFEPIYQYRLWGGRQLSNLLTTPLPGNDPIGEAWLLSDREDHQSIIADGPLKGNGIGQLMKSQVLRKELLGKLAGRFTRFPLLLKFLDVHEMLSVQVHPSDKHPELLPPGESGKTEAWVVLEAGPNSRIYAGLKQGTTIETLRQAIRDGAVEDQLESFIPKPGNSVLITAGTAHALGGDVVVFEIQQNSDVTFRLYDWNHIDPKTGKPRELQVDQAMACIDYSEGAVSPVMPVVEEVKPVLRERILHCDYFIVWRLNGELQFKVGKADTPHILACISGEGQLEHNGNMYAINKGDVILLPAIVGECICHPNGTITLLEISIPEGA
ncbi:MAG TPA: mannose-6-phosphate isomerase [Prolixibacteraceae bacterium]|jgi:mannose-6-phosphate isomerase|nr:mannose-6-phosphate isomerase [Prolixibacteraceae bacterium]